MLPRILIDAVRPRTPDGAFPAKAVAGRNLTVSADIFRDGHDILAANALLDGTPIPLTMVGNDRWEGTAVPEVVGSASLSIEAWVDAWATWAHKIEVKHAAGQDVSLECEEGARLCEDRLPAVAKALRDGDVAAALTEEVAEAMAGPLPDDHVTRWGPTTIWVDRERAAIGAWYELFPRSYGGLRATADDRLPAVAEMGFDVVYLPPIHPIGVSFRKGRNNSLDPQPGDPGSPWAIGGPEGGHTAIHPDLGTFEDFDHLMSTATGLGLEVALDFALQCSPDHPWVAEHPEWFHRRPDGSIAYAENPPKKYQDIYPINFWPELDEDRQALWEACRDVVRFWADKGVRIFRVDNPHTKPIAFWAWMIGSLRDMGYEDLVYLAEAFTAPKMMAKLAEVGFSQSYTYFAWRLTREELTEYVTELSQGPTADYMRPNFWPNTPDILSGPLRNGNRAAFELRLVLAAFLVPSYGIYSGYELMENQPFAETNEEYRDSEKYEIKPRLWDRPDTLVPLIARVNTIRRQHPSLWDLPSVRFHGSTNDQLLVFSRESETDTLLVVVNLDPHNAQEGLLDLDLFYLGIGWEEPYLVHDELTGETYAWQGRSPYVRLDPLAPEPRVAHVLTLRRGTGPS